ncbi:hypothetical protein N7520_009371 [Penicillium odoratum]|uniref:uncharacterized protein n=1 Tax=Penicillium odoratum TaxID=1167516 RepID=UPI0025466F07|nr:uncharacterized protein N7520_009371 [Penicillium odoratum]KAJ5752454.1 hypothetical protein N7520_009371 [Penicillium odoratum]
MSREIVIRSRHPRQDALKFVTEYGKHTLKVEQFIPAARPSGLDSHSSHPTRRIMPGGRTAHEPAIKSVSGYVIETGKSFTICDDYDFANPSSSGLGFHVNAQLGRETRAYTSGRNSSEEYYDRAKMTDEWFISMGSRMLPGGIRRVIYAESFGRRIYIYVYAPHVHVLSP